MNAIQFGISVFLLALFGGWFVYHVTVALRSGVANAAGVSHKRSKRPVMFWTTVAAQTAFAAVFFAYLTFRLITHR